MAITHHFTSDSEFLSLTWGFLQTLPVVYFVTETHLEVLSYIHNKVIKRIPHTFAAKIEQIIYCQYQQKDTVLMFCGDSVEIVSELSGDKPTFTFVQLEFKICRAVKGCDSDNVYIFDGKGRLFLISLDSGSDGDPKLESIDGFSHKGVDGAMVVRRNRQENEEDLVVISKGDGVLKVWKLENDLSLELEKEVKVLRGPKNIFAVSSNVEWALLGTSAGSILSYPISANATTTKPIEIKHKRTYGKQITDMIITPDMKQVIAGSDNFIWRFDYMPQLFENKENGDQKVESDVEMDEDEE
ncbi:hypothetical protein HK098_005932 [Nowakowskiella sp. JEL0407]|nr:hypothetical protein HK098_005932 [Nowakowskiella sp. JEL0407]